MARRIVVFAVVCAAALALAGSGRGATLRVASNGVDGPACGTKAEPCRSITQAIANAAPGDRIVVGPGRYGDLHGDGLLEAGIGDELGAPGCGCVVAVNKPVFITSSDGAAATIIDARAVAVTQNVLLITDGGAFGSPGKGFTVTQTKTPQSGIAIDSNDVAVRGNQVLAIPSAPESAGWVGIRAVGASPTILIEANQVVGWRFGIYLAGTGATVRRNQVALNGQGIVADAGNVVSGNVVTANDFGVLPGAETSVTGNALHGNHIAMFVTAGGHTVRIEGNNFVANSLGIRNFTPEDPIIATGNFWGTAAGPGADAVEDGMGGTTTVIPFAVKPFKVKAPIKP